MPALIDRLDGLIEHLVGSEETSTAATAADLAARLAGIQLQFEREAELLALAVRLGGGLPDDWTLIERRGVALANAGRGREAGEAFAEALKGLAPGIEMGTDARTRLMSRAGTQYLYAGYLNEGQLALTNPLRDLGIPVPEGARAARLASLRLRGRFLLRGFRLPQGPARPISARDELRLEAAFGACVGLSMLDFVLSDSIAIWRLLEILRLGATAHLAQALALEASSEAAVGGSWWWKRSERLLDAAERLAEAGIPFDRATVLCCRSSLHYYRGWWESSLLDAEAALKELEQCPEQKHPRAITNAYRLGANAHLGDLRRLAELRDELLIDARRRGDVFSENLLHSAEFVLVRLAHGEPDDAIRDADEILKSFKAEHFTSQHYHHLIATVKANLYAGRGMEAWRAVDDASWKRVEESGFLKLVFIGTHLRYHRACAALGAAQTVASDRTDGSEPARYYLSVAEREARRIERSPLPCAKPWSAVIRAGIASQTGGDAEPLLESARAGFEGELVAMSVRRPKHGAREGPERRRVGSMALHENAASICLARLRGERAPTAETWMKEQGVLEPLLLARALVPVYV